MGIISSITDITCNTYTKTKQNVYFCCKNQVTGAHFDCNSNKKAIKTSTGKTFLTNLNCYNTTKWYVTTTNSTGKKKRKLSKSAVIKSLSACVTSSWCYQSIFCLDWCVPYSVTLWTYVSAEPLQDYNVRLFKVQKNDQEAIISNNGIRNASKWAIQFINEYNSKTTGIINTYIESTGGVGTCTDIVNNSGLKFTTFWYPYSNHASIITTILCSQLRTLPYTTDKKIYRKNVYILSAPLLFTYFKNYLKQPLNKPLAKKYGKSIWLNYYLNDGKFNVFLRATDSAIMFTYYIISEAAKTAGVTNNDNFKKQFFNLMYKIFIPTLSLTTEQVNTAFANFTPELLKKNYNSVFKNWYNAIYSSNDMGFVIGSQYAALYVSYTALLDNNYTEQVNTFSNCTTIRQKYQYYRENALKGVGPNLVYQKVNVLSQNQKNAVINLITNIINYNESSAENFKTKLQNVRSSCKSCK